MHNEFGLQVARILNGASEEEWPERFERLLRDRQLSTAIGQINTLLDDPDYRQEAVDALRRIGFGVARA